MRSLREIRDFQAEGARSERDSDRRRQLGQADSAAIGARLIRPDDHSDVSYVKGFR